MRIDVHAHYWTYAYLDMLIDLGRSDTATQRGIAAGVVASGWLSRVRRHSDASHRCRDRRNIACH